MEYREMDDRDGLVHAETEFLEPGNPDLFDDPDEPDDDFDDDDDDDDDFDMRLMECKCGLKIRTTQKWIDEYGPEWPCPCGESGWIEPSRRDRQA